MKRTGVIVGIVQAQGFRLTAEQADMEGRGLGGDAWRVDHGRTDRQGRTKTGPRARWVHPPSRRRLLPRVPRDEDYVPMTTQESPDSLALVKITDYGLGTFNGQPLVLWGRNAYHRHDHGGRVRGATFTEEFLIEGWHVPRCKVCFPHG